MRADNDITALVIAIVILSRGNNELRTKSIRALEARKNALAKAREHQIPMGGPVPGWLRVVGKGDDRRVVVIERRAHTVKHLWELAASMGEWQIADELTRKKTPPINPRATKSTSSMVRYLLSESGLAVLDFHQPYHYVIDPGDKKRRRVPDGAPFKLSPAIIENALFDRVIRARKE